MNLARHVRLELHPVTRRQLRNLHGMLAQKAFKMLLFHIEKLSGRKRSLPSPLASSWH